MALTTELARPFPNAPLLGFDIETNFKKVPSEGWIVVISISDGHDAITIDTRPIIPPRLAIMAPADLVAALHLVQVQCMHDWLTHDVFDREIICHNALFDLEWVCDKYGVECPARVHDTMLTEQACTAGLELAVSLAAVAERRCDFVMDKQYQTSFTLETPSPEQVEYAENDTKWLIAIREQQMRELRQQGLVTVNKIEHAALPVFVAMKLAGVWVDRARIEPLIEREKEIVARHRAHLTEELTQYVMVSRLAKFDAMQAALADWEQRRADEIERIDDDWQRQIDQFASLVAQGAERWDDEAALRHHFGDDWIDAKWHDQTIDKKDGLAKGRKRYRTVRIREWREERDLLGKQPNQRPAKPNLDGGPINIASNPQMQAALGELGITITDPTGKPTLKAKAIKAYLPECDPALRERILVPLLAYKKSSKMVEAFGDKLLSMLDPDDRLHGNFRQWGTKTGRPTCSTPNMLQMPNRAEFRACFRASPGHLLIVADYSQMELRIMAEMSQDPVLLKAFREGTDLHTLTAAGIFGVPFDQVTKQQRAVGKTANFGILYGLGPTGLRVQLAGLDEPIFLTQEEAQAALAGWRNTYQAAAALIDRWGAEGIRQGWTATTLGRRRNFYTGEGLAKWEKGAIRRRAANHPIQGGNADVMKLAMASVQRQLVPLGGTVVLQVYDELVCEVPDAAAFDAAVIVKSTMLAAAQVAIQSCPIAVDCTISPSWSEEEGAGYERERVWELHDEESYDDLDAE